MVSILSKAHKSNPKEDSSESYSGIFSLGLRPGKEKRRRKGWRRSVSRIAGIVLKFSAQGCWLRGGGRRRWLLVLEEPPPREDGREGAAAVDLDLGSSGLQLRGDAYGAVDGSVLRRLPRSELGLKP
ncbi:UNVERIFIED_CONTAM: hypothetical protein K2H54_058112 [Gekko kuhli]